MKVAANKVLIVGAGLYGAVCAHELVKREYEVTVIDKRSHIGGNLYTKDIEGIPIHWYGAHIFHTSNKKIWNYINQFGEFNSFVNSPMAKYKNGLYNLPFNMNTFNELWGIYVPIIAKQKIEKQRAHIDNPKNLEEQALNLVGKDIYKKFIKGYTEKQWGKSALDLPPNIINRIPLRFTFDNNYFNDKYQGVPVEGYTKIIMKMLAGCKIRLNKPFTEKMTLFYDFVIYTGAIDEYFDYVCGNLEYRSLSFKHYLLNSDNFQGNAVINHTERKIPYTRTIEHKFFYQEKFSNNKTVVTYEYPAKWKRGREAYYPIADEKNKKLYKEYKKLSKTDSKIIFGGRLGLYKYIDMDETIDLALQMIEREFD